MERTRKRRERIISEQAISIITYCLGYSEYIDTIAVDAAPYTSYNYRNKRDEKMEKVWKRRRRSHKEGDDTEREK